MGKARRMPITWPALALVASALMVPLVEYGDFVTGQDVRFDLFYFVPVAVATRFAGRWGGFALAGLCAFASGMAEYVAGGAYFTWNSVVDFGVLGVLTLVLAKLQESLVRERAAARTDALTGAANRRQFLETVTAEVGRSRRYGHALSLAILDLDHFKEVNDSRGHAEGDAVLVATAETLRGALRASDTVARLGGDEFAVLFPETGPESAGEVLHKLRDRLAEVYRQGGWPITVSIGAITFATPPDEVDAVIREVDGHLYRAKGAGKDTLVHESRS